MGDKGQGAGDKGQGAGAGDGKASQHSTSPCLCLYSSTWCQGIAAACHAEQDKGPDERGRQLSAGLGAATLQLQLLPGTFPREGTTHRWPGHSPG